MFSSKVYFFCNVSGHIGNSIWDSFFFFFFSFLDGISVCCRRNAKNVCPDAKNFKSNLF